MKSLLRSLRAPPKRPLARLLRRSNNTRLTLLSNSACRFFSTARPTRATSPAWWALGGSMLLATVGLGAYELGLSSGKSALHRPSPSVPLTRESPTYASKEDLELAIAQLRDELGQDAVSTDDDDLHRHGYSEWSSINIDQLPVAVCYPKSTEEVSLIAQTATKYHVPMVPYSGGSSLEANFSAPHGGFSIDFAFMDQILAIHEDDMDVVVQPAVQWMALNDAIAHTGLFFPVDPGPSAKIGGMVGTSCSGTNAFRWGPMKDWVINLTVVLPDGRIIKTRRRPRKTAAGYNLTGLFIGAEGSLGLVTEATLKLAAIPQETKVGVVTFPSIRHAAAAAMQVIRSGIPVAAMEIMDDVQMSVINRAGGTNRTWDEVATIFFKFSGTTAGVQDNIKSASVIAKANQGGKMIYAKTDQEAHDLWKARKDSLWSMLSLRKDGEEIWSTDVAVPLSRLPDLIEISKNECEDLGLFASILGHIGDGNFHASVLYNRGDPEQRRKVEAVVYNMVGRALEMEGTCTGEHGIGVGKKKSLVDELGEETIDIMRTLKRSVDPLWIMNPGKIFDAVPDQVETLAEAKLDRQSSN